MQNYLISPSILSAHFARLGEEAAAVLKAGGDNLHFDVMDNHFVPNLTIGPLVCNALRDFGITAPIDVHLMVQPVDRLIVDFAKTGATSITIHPEATDHLDQSLALIREQGCLAGLALNPETPLTCLDNRLDKLDIILVMSVNPGFAGQKFMTESLTRLKQIRSRINQTNRTIRLAIDGGINLETIYSAAEAGADTFVAGSAIFGQPNYETIINALRHELKRVK